MENNVRTISLEFAVTPVAKGRPRLGRFGRVFTPTKTRVFERTLGALARSQFKESLLLGPLHVGVVFRFERPKSVKREHHTIKPDLDNLVKCLDALNGVIWHDDAQIVSLSATKEYAMKPGIFLTVRTI